MGRKQWLAFIGFACIIAASSAANAQARPYIGYVYPAGGRQGTTVQIRLGGQNLANVNAALVSGTGVKAKVTEYFQRLGNQELSLMREQLAELLRAGLLTEVQAPTPEQEAVRDLCRAREDAKQDQMRCRHRLGKLLLRRGLVYSGGKRAWGQTHRQWLRSLRFERAEEQAVLSDYLLAVEQVEERIKTLEQQLTTAAESALFREPVGWLRCFRGIDTVTAVTLVAELHGIERFTSPRALMAYVGLVPSEYSSAQCTRRGGITKAGNSHARRVLIEATWHYRHPPRISARLSARRQGQPPAVIAIADKAQQRLYRRQRHLATHGKTATQAVVAGARELTGFIWAALLHHQLSASV